MIKICSDCHKPIVLEAGAWGFKKKDEILCLVCMMRHDLEEKERARREK